MPDGREKTGRCFVFLVFRSGKACRESSRQTISSSKVRTMSCQRKETVHAYTFEPSRWGRPPRRRLVGLSTRKCPGAAEPDRPLGRHGSAGSASRARNARPSTASSTNSAKDHLRVRLRPRGLLWQLGLARLPDVLRGWRYGLDGHV